MAYKIDFAQQFVRQYEKLDPPIRARVHKAVDNLVEDPYAGKRLRGLLSDRWSYRVGGYRILYKIFQDRFLILALTVGHRREIYR